VSAEDPTAAELLTQINAAIYGIAVAIAARKVTSYSVGGTRFEANGDSLRALRELRDQIQAEVNLASADRPRVLLGDISGRPF